jgi:hypothetical protein
MNFNKVKQKSPFIAQVLAGGRERLTCTNLRQKSGLDIILTRSHRSRKRLACGTLLINNYINKSFSIAIISGTTV